MNLTLQTNRLEAKRERGFFICFFAFGLVAQPPLSRRFVFCPVNVSKSSVASIASLSSWRSSCFATRYASSIYTQWDTRVNFWTTFTQQVIKILLARTEAVSPWAIPLLFAKGSWPRYFPIVRWRWKPSYICSQVFRNFGSSPRIDPNATIILGTTRSKNFWRSILIPQMACFWIREFSQAKAIVCEMPVLFLPGIPPTTVLGNVVLCKE